MIHLLTAVGLSPGGSSTVHIYTQTINRTTQNQQYIDQHNNCGRIIRTRRSAYRRGLASVLESCLAMFCTWYLCPVCWLRLLTLSITHYVSVCCLTSLLRTPPLSLSLSLTHTHTHTRTHFGCFVLRNAPWIFVITPDGAQSFLAETCSLIRTEYSVLWTDDNKIMLNEWSPKFLMFRGSHSGKVPTVTLMWSESFHPDSAWKRS